MAENSKSVYVLKDPDTGEVKYVGVSSDPKSRATVHLRGKDRHTGNWVNKMVARGKQPIFEVVYDRSPAWKTLEYELYLEHQPDLNHTIPKRDHKSAGSEYYEWEVGNVVGPRIRQARTSASLTQFGLANEIKASQPVISYWEDGTLVPNIAQLHSIAKATSTPVQKFIPTEDEIIESTTTLRASAIARQIKRGQ